MEINFKLFLILQFFFKFIFTTPYDFFLSSIRDNNSSYPLDNICFCDKIQGFCDPYCCCDKDCESVYAGGGKLLWTFYQQCLTPPQNDYEKYFENCQNTTRTARIEDLYNPIRVFYQNIRKGFCPAVNNGNFNTSIITNFTAGNTTEVTDLIKQYTGVDDINEKTVLFNLKTFQNNIPKLYYFNSTNFNGYTPKSPIMIQYSNSYDTLKFPVVLPSGRCKNNLDFIRYIENKEITCSYKLTYESNSCLNFNRDNIYNDFSYPILVGFNTTTNLTMNIFPITKLYKVSNKLYYTELSNNNIVDPSINTFQNIIINNGCKCNNLVTSVNYDFLMQNELIVGLNIVYFLEDFTSGCGKQENIAVNYKVNFKAMNESYTYSRSGNPGYIRGKPLITGKANSLEIYNNATGLNETNEFVEQYNQPRLLYGVGQEANDRGACYYSLPLSGVDETLQPLFIQNPNNPVFGPPYANFTALGINQPSLSIYHNPLYDNSLTYEDKISWGCRDQLNFTGLRYYCTNQLWKKKMLFEVVNNISYIGKFGNADRHHLLDWTKINENKLFDIEAYQSTWDAFYNKCTIPGILNIDILYATFGLVNNTQHAVVKVQFRLDYTFWWSKNIINTDVKDNFYTYVNINYIRVPQDTVWWYAPGPKAFKLPQNIMYPFRIGTTDYGIANEGGRKIELNLIFIFLTIFLYF